MPDPKDDPKAAPAKQENDGADVPAADEIAIEKPIEENDFNAQPQ